MRYGLPPIHQKAGIEPVFGHPPEKRTLRRVRGRWRAGRAESVNTRDTGAGDAADGQVTVGFSRLSSRGTSRLASLQAILGLLRLREKLLSRRRRPHAGGAQSKSNRNLDCFYRLLRGSRNRCREMRGQRRPRCSGRSD